MSDQSIAIVCALLPLFAVLIVFCTPKGCNRTINTLLACLIIFIFGFEEAVRSDVAVSLGIYDGRWFDASIIAIYGAMILLFYRVGARIQLGLSLVGALLGVWYYLSWSGDTRPINLFYSESFIFLTVLQLIVASDTPLKSLLNKMLNGGENGGPNTRSHKHGIGVNSAHSDKS